MSSINSNFASIGKLSDYVSSSNFASVDKLSDDAVIAHDRYKATPDVQNRIDFYYSYLINVVPSGVMVHYTEPDQTRLSDPYRELQLLMPAEDDVSPEHREILMSGLVFCKSQKDSVDSVAANQAYTHWRNGSGKEVRNWRILAAETKIRFFDSDKGLTWNHIVDFDPMKEPEELVVYLRNLFNMALNHKQWLCLAELRD